MHSNFIQLLCVECNISRILYIDNKEIIRGVIWPVKYLYKTYENYL